jgi:hypothetical protein
VNVFRWVAVCAVGWALVIDATCASCASLPRPVLSSDDARAVDVFVAAWDAARLPSLASCDIDRTDVLHTTTSEQFALKCGVPAKYAAACTANWKHQRGMVVKAYPLVVLRPEQPSIDNVGGGPVVHELIHWASRCTEGPLDERHQDPRYWEAASKDPAVRAVSVQGRARAMLTAPAHPAPR